MSKRPALVVEDDLDLLENFADVLESGGYVAYKAENGKQALELLEKLKPDQLPGCIVLDLMMPVMDGKTFLEELARKHPNDWAKIPILLATAMGKTRYSPGELPLPVRVLSKPVDLDEFLAEVERACGS